MAGQRKLCSAGPISDAARWNLPVLRGTASQIASGSAAASVVPLAGHTGEERAQPVTQTAVLVARRLQ